MVRAADGEHAAALALYVAELGCAMRDAGWRSEPTWTALVDLARAQQGLGRYAAARAALDEVARVQGELLGPEHPALAKSLQMAGRVALKVGDLDGAARSFARALDIRKRAYGSHSAGPARGARSPAGNPQAQSAPGQAAA